MAKEGSLFTFLAGAAIGAAIVYLNTTEKGRALAKEGERMARKFASELFGQEETPAQDEPMQAQETADEQ